MGFGKGIRKVPMIMQFEAVECGAASLAMILAYYGKWITMEQSRVACGVSRDGSSAKNICLAARKMGLEARAFRMEPEMLAQKAVFPCILHWNMSHFVVLKGIKNSLTGGLTYEINDPARGEVSIPPAEFDECFTGVVLCFEPGEDFRKEGKRRSMLSFAMQRLTGAWPALLFFILTSVLMYLLQVVDTVIARIYIDRVLSYVNLKWVSYLMIAVFACALFQTVVGWQRAIYSYRISSKMALTGATGYMWKVLRLPMQFFQQRLAGDIQMRLNLNASIAETLLTVFAPLLLNTVMMAFYLVLMLRQSMTLSVVGLTALVLNVRLSYVISQKRIRFARVRMRDEGKLAGTTVTGIQMIETIKSAGAENGFFQKWAGTLAVVNDQKVKSDYMEQYLGQLPNLLVTIANSIVLCLGVRLVMQGHMTVGALYMFQGFLSQFAAPAMDMVRAGQAIQEMRTRMERVDDVMAYEEDPILSAHSLRDQELQAAGQQEEQFRKLRGEIELSHVTFGYSTLAPALIEDFSVHIRPGDKIALVGASGSGKSTISALVSGLYQPWSGQILFDGKPREHYLHEVMTSSVAVVDQDIILFDDTVAANIKMFDSSIQDFEMIMAARDADIHDEIRRLPGGYRHMLVSGGGQLSGGQRQQIEIARALALDPTVLIMDEATSALDAATEERIMHAISERGITCIVIAHRLSTIRDCDQILVLDQGRVCERGTHDQLMAMGGKYRELVEND